MRCWISSTEARARPNILNWFQGGYLVSTDPNAEGKLEEALDDTRLSRGRKYASQANSIRERFPGAGETFLQSLHPDERAANAAHKDETPSELFAGASIARIV